MHELPPWPLPPGPAASPHSLAALLRGVVFMLALSACLTAILVGPGLLADARAVNAADAPAWR